ncbi:MAG: hypothetical protein HUJ71_04775 [Pseudobutyrivibrio sp.]|nr:hypothetical protein [Pseudobutyrivibrio sp.]
MNTNIKSSFIKLWEGMGIASIALLLCLPNGKTAVTTILNVLNVKSKTYMGLSIADFVAVILFLIVYYTSYKFFPKERATKLFSIVTSLLMIITLASKIIFS